MRGGSAGAGMRALEAADFALYMEHCARIAYGALDLQAIPNDARIGKQARHPPFVETSDASRLEVGKRFTIRIPFIQYGLPRQTRLGTFEHQELEQQAVVVDWYAPFLVMIGHHARVVPGPRATRIVGL